MNGFVAWSRWRAVVIGLLVSTGTHAAPLVTYLPEYPVPDKPVALRVDDITIVGGNVVGPHRASVIGNTILIEGCLGTRGIPTFATPAVTIAIPPLPSGRYAIEYYRSIQGEENCRIDAAPLSLVVTSSIVVSPASPTWPPSPGPVAIVYEYRNALFGTNQFPHHFMTSLEDEKLAIETGQFSGWNRVRPTGWTPQSEDFGFYTAPGEGLLPMCRFFTVAFAPKSSHFYTANPAECELVKQNPSWLFEGVVGYVAPPNHDGSCSVGVPLYRLYNNGQTGVPNHYYTDSADRRSTRLNAGWSPEGVGPGVAACVPRRQ